MIMDAIYIILCIILNTITLSVQFVPECFCFFFSTEIFSSPIYSSIMTAIATNCDKLKWLTHIHTMQTIIFPIISRSSIITFGHHGIKINISIFMSEFIPRVIWKNNLIISAKTMRSIRASFCIIKNCHKNSSFHSFPRRPIQGVSAGCNPALIGWVIASQCCNVHLTAFKTGSNPTI